MPAALCAIDHVAVDQAEARAVEGNGPLFRILNRVADEIELVSGVRRILRSQEVMQVDGVAPDLIRADMRGHFIGVEGRAIEVAKRVGASQILKSGELDIDVGACRVHRVAARTIGVLGANDHIAAQEGNVWYKLQLSINVGAPR